MLGILILIFTCWIGFKVCGLLFKVTWSVAKLFASLLLAVAVPTLIACLLFAGGIVLLIPAAMVLAAFGLLKSA